MSDAGSGEPLVLLAIVLSVRILTSSLASSNGMVSVLTSSAVDCGSNPGRVKPKNIILLFVAFQLSIAALRSKTKD